MNLKEMMEAALKAARDIAEKAVQEKRDLTADEVSAFDQKMAEFDDLKAKLEQAKASEDRFAKLAAINPGHKIAGEESAAKSLGEHFVKHVGADELVRLKNQGGYTVWAPEFKAATDAHTVGTSFSAWLTDVDKNIQHGYRRPVVSDLLGTGSISGTAVTYYVEGAFEGSFATVAEGAQKPQIHLANPTPTTDALKKIAAWFDISDEMVEDVPFMVSEINNRGLYMLALFEEAQLLTGDGTGTNILGLLNRSGIQTETQAPADDSAQDAIFRAMTKVQTATGLQPDACIINPADYQTMRLAKDANDQYYGGGFFQGQYGQGGLAWQPPIWGLNTVVSAAVPAKTVVVGALKAATTVYRKGGIRVESTNSDLGKFTKNVITTRIEERIALAVRQPAAVVKTTLV